MIQAIRRKKAGAKTIIKLSLSLLGASLNPLKLMQSDEEKAKIKQLLQTKNHILRRKKSSCVTLLSESKQEGELRVHKR